MKILILGGTRFVGRHITEAAVTRGHDVALFNRGRTLPDGINGTRLVRGDRRMDVTALATEQWDCVIDVNGYQPEDVRLSAEALSGRAAHYVYISTVSVYADTIPPGADEHAAMIEIPLEVDDDHPQSYGGRKANCDRVLADIWSDQPLTIIRPTVVIGPHDTTDRFTYWVRRVSQGGRVAVPINRAQPIQLVDARDLATFTLDTVEKSVVGVFNVAGPETPVKLGELIDRIAVVTGAHIVEQVPVSDADLEAAGTSLPLKLPDTLRGAPMFQVSIAAALGAGLRLRSFDESIRDTLAWDRERGLPPLLAGPEPETEHDLLAAVATRP